MNANNHSSEKRVSSGNGRPTAKRQVSMNGAPTARPSHSTRSTHSEASANPSQASRSRVDNPTVSQQERIGITRQTARPANGAKPRGSHTPTSHPALPSQQKQARTVSSRGGAAAKPNRNRPLVTADNTKDNRTGGTLITSLVKAVIYIMSILVVSGFLSYYAIHIGNDVFAFVKSDETVQITIPSDTNVTTLGNMLADSGIIQYPKVFDFYVGLRYDKNLLEFASGDYTISPSMSYDKLIATFAKQEKPLRTTVIVSIPEGYTVKQIIDTLVNKYGLSSEEELVNAIQTADFDYWFLDELEKNGTKYGRKYRLEGYLYPDTYYYYSDASAETIINKMLKNFDTKMKNTFKNSLAEGNTYQEKILNLCAAQGMTLDEVVTLASMIQMEAKLDIEYGTISSVFHNRLQNTGKTNGLLESCATVLYFLEIRVPVLSDEQTKINDPYNTYIYQGLPPGSISNPTYLAINYALYPESTDYYYFVAAPNGTSLFAKTYKEHQENIKIADQMREDS